MYIKMIWIILCIFLNECEGKRSDNQSPYQAYLTGPYWTYPVQKTVLIKPDFFEEEPLIRFKRDVDHEFPRDVPTKPNYDNKGSWARGKIPGKETDIGFVPVQSYSQVRRYDTVKHLPRSAALKEASTPEEIAAAPRLREVLSNKKIQQVYEEEGYEDSGYDHGGYNHQGAKYEDHEQNDELDHEHSEDSQIRSAESVRFYANPEETTAPAIKPQITQSIKKNTEDISLEEETPKFEDTGKYIINHKRFPAYTKTIEERQNKTYYDDSSREKLEESKETVEMIETAESRSGFEEPEVRVVNDPRPKGSNSVTFPGRHTRRQYALGRPTDNWSPMAPADVYVQESVGYNVRRPIYPPIQNVHHHLPYVPFPNYYSDSPAAYASPVPQILNKPTSNPHLAEINAYASLLTNNQTTNKTDYIDLIQPRNQTLDLEKRKNRQYYNFTRNNKPREEITRQSSWTWNHPFLNTRHPSLPRDTNGQYSDQIDALIKPKDNEYGPVKYIEQLTVAHYSSRENISVTPEQNNTRLIELAEELNAEVGRSRSKREALTVSYDSEKYPYYHRVLNRNISNRDSALKYATNQDMLPKKKGGMEFYESRDKLVKCTEPSPPDVIPEKDHDGEWNKNPQPEMPRLKGLGDSIECMKRKYFGKEPLDNPFFQEEIDSPKYEPDEEIEKHKKRESTKRLMVFNNTNLENKKNYKNHKMNNNNTIVVFPYKNHKPETTSPRYDMRITKPYQYDYSDNHYSIYENPDEGDLTQDSSKKHHHYRPYKHKIHKKKRYRPYQPVSIYSVISHGYPNYYRPLVYAHSVKSHRIVPVYPLSSSTQSTDSIASDAQANPTKFYIIRPGEYTENKDLTKDKKETPSIWSYMNPLNPLKWWFPSLFDNRRKEPKYRKRRDTDYKPYEKVKFEDVSGEYSENYQVPLNHKPETTIGPPITLSEFKLKMNITDNKPRINRLTAGYISRNNVPNIGAKLPDLTPYVVLTTQPTTRSLQPPTLKPKIIFPKTKSPRKPLEYKIQNPEKIIQYTTTTTTQEPTTVVTRMYKPKRIVNKNSKKPVNAFDILNRKTTTEYPFESKEENPNPNLEKIERRKVTKEEVFKTNYTPEEDKSKSDEIEYSASKPEDRISEANQTLTYLVDPTTGIGRWGEQPKEIWKPKIKRKYEKRQRMYNTNPKRSLKIRELPGYSEAYVFGLMSKIPPPDIRYYGKQQNKNSKREPQEYYTEEEIHPSPTRKATQFILEPDKRKYYYIND